MATIDLGKVVGPQGPQGPQGERGPAGPAGAQGPAGARGERGYGSNPNLLDNWYFVGPVNQRGKTAYSGVGYTIDRWRKYTTNISLMVSNGHLSLVRAAAAGNPMVFQFFEEPGRYAGKTMTLSILARGNQGMRFGLVDAATVGAEAPQNFKYVTLTADWNLYQYTYTVQSGVSAAYFQSMAAAVGQYIDIKAVKLELGDTQTLAHQDASGSWVLNDPPPDRALELAKCQRYYQRYDKANAFCAVAYLSNTKAKLFLPTPVTMRANPAVAISGQFDTYTAAGESMETELTYSGNGVLSDNGITVMQATTGEVFQAAVSLLFPLDGFDGLIELSAEL